jgi:hypothetical protein
MTDQNMMKEEDRKEFTKRMETRRAEQRQIVADELKNQKKEEGGDVSDIDKALGLDNDDEMFMPELGGGYGNPFGGGFGGG